MNKFHFYKVNNEQYCGQYLKQVKQCMKYIIVCYFKVDDTVYLYLNIFFPIANLN